MLGGYYSKYREIFKELQQNRNARDIFDYLCFRAAFMPYVTKINRNEYQLQIGELIASPNTIADEHSWTENKKKVCYSVQEVKSALNFLKKLKIIDIEPLPTKKDGSKITIIPYKNKVLQPEPSLEPQGIQTPLQPEEGGLQPVLQPELQPIPQPEPALEPEGLERPLQPVLQPELQPELQPDIINNNIFKNNVLRKDLEEAEGARVTDLNSIVNTTAQIFSYFFTKVSKKITPTQEGWLNEFIDSGMQPELLMAIMDRAGENSDQSAPAYVIKTCRTLLKENTLTLDKWQHNASQYRQKNHTGRGKQKELSTRKGVQVPENYLDGVNF